MANPVKNKREIVSGKEIIIEWKCGDCANRGKLKVKLPIQMRTFHMRMEESHAKVRGHIMCPSSYFEIISIKT